MKLYDVDDELVLIDTPGLFGFKDKLNVDTTKIEKYKDITKNYISEAHLVLYVMDSTNPIKGSHKDDLLWLFKTLNLLSRTVFVLSRFDEIADVEDDNDFKQALNIKEVNVKRRLVDILELDKHEHDDLTIVGVSANPFELGVEHWLENKEQFKKISRISCLQTATALKISQNGGQKVIMENAKNTIIADILNKQLPLAQVNDEKLKLEVDKLNSVSVTLNKQLKNIGGNIAETKVALRSFIVDYFSDLIVQVKGLSIDTFEEFFERAIGSEGIVINNNIQNEFNEQIGLVQIQLDKLKVEFHEEVNHYNTIVNEYGRQGLKYALKSNVINRQTVLAARDGIINVSKFAGVDLAKYLKFKPWGALKFAQGLKGALAVLGLALELWDSYKENEKIKEFNKAIVEFVDNFEKQRKELIELVDSHEFIEIFFSEYIMLEKDVNEINVQLTDLTARSDAFRIWREEGEIIEAEFREIK